MAKSQRPVGMDKLSSSVVTSFVLDEEALVETYLLYVNL